MKELLYMHFYEVLFENLLKMRMKERNEFWNNVIINHELMVKKYDLVEKLD
jgi:hypothetical protein